METKTIYIAPQQLSDEMRRLREDEQMDFLESLTGMDWGEPAENDTPRPTERLRSGISSGIDRQR